MKQKLSSLFLFFSLMFFSCEFNDQKIEYQEKLVVFGSIVANLPITDTVTVSKSASISEDILAQDLWINDAEVFMVNDSTKDTLLFKNVDYGKYFPIDEQSNIDEITKYASYIIDPGATYSLVVNHDIGSVIATTTVPNEMNISSADLGDYNCPDGQVLATKNIDVNNFENLSFEEMIEFYQDPNQYVIQNNINVDSVTYRFGDCFTRSFASYPMFGVDFEADVHQTVKIISFALEANKKGLEPLDSLSSTISAEGDPFFDFNYNKVRDSVFVNLIYDTTLGFRIWKGQYLRDENSNPYRINPWQWNIETAPSPMMWLYFDYYGLHLVSFMSTSESYFNYFSGDPVGQNIYLLPNSNIEGGLGVLYSSFTSSFLVYIKKDE